VKVTVITVCFNGAAVIRTALESVLRQSWRDLEYLVVDGGSTDGTVSIIEEFVPKFGGRLRWMSEPDRGMYDALNKGIGMASGEFVGILNADDALSDDRVVERVAEALRREPETEALYGDVRFVENRAGQSLDELRGGHTLRAYSAKRWRPWMLQWGYMPPHPSVYIRRSCFTRLGGYALDYRIAADYALLIRFLRRAKLRLLYVPQCFVDMRVGGVSTKNWRSNLLLNQEIVRGNREAGYYCCLPMLVPKYAFKVWEFFGKK
jgi:glycosyltransferase involved in cell wall biosynthesis